MKIEYTATELDKVLNYNDSLQVWLETLKIMKKALLKFGLELVEESVQWKMDKTRHGGTEYKFEYLKDFIYIHGSDEDSPRTDRFYVTRPYGSPPIKLNGYKNPNENNNVTSWRRAPTGSEDEPYREKTEFINRDIKDFAVFYDKRAKVYLYLEVCNTNNHFYYEEDTDKAELYKKRKYNCDYELWYDLLYEYDKDKLYEEQKYGASVSQVIPELTNDKRKFHYYFEQFSCKEDLTTGNLIHERRRCFMRPPMSGDNILITYNRGYFSMCFYNSLRKFWLNTPQFIYVTKLNYVGDELTYSVATNEYIAMYNEGQPDRRFRFFYMLRKNWKYYCYFYLQNPNNPIQYVLFSRFIARNKMDMSFILQDVYNYEGFFDENTKKIGYNYVCAIDGIPKYDKSSKFTLEESYTEHRLDNTMMSNTDNTLVKFPLVYYVTRQPLNTNTLSALLEVDSINLIESSNKHNGDIYIERNGDDITKSILVNKWMGKTNTLIMLEYYKRINLLDSINDDIIALRDKLLDYDKIIIKTDDGNDNVIDIDFLEKAFISNKPVNLTGNDNLVYNIIIESNTVLRVVKSDKIKIISIVGIRG